MLPHPTFCTKLEIGDVFPRRVVTQMLFTKTHEASRFFATMRDVSSIVVIMTPIVISIISSVVLVIISIRNSTSLIVLLGGLRLIDCVVIIFILQVLYAISWLGSVGIIWTFSYCVQLKSFGNVIEVGSLGYSKITGREDSWLFMRVSSLLWKESLEICTPTI